MNFLGYDRNPMLGSFAPPSYALPQFGTAPGLRVPMQGSEPGLRMPQPSDTAPFNTQFGKPPINMGMLGIGSQMLTNSEPQQPPIPQLSLLMPQNRGDFSTLYANFLKGLLA